MQTDYSKHSLRNFGIVSLLFTGVLYVCLYSPPVSNPLLLAKNCPNPQMSKYNISFQVDELQLALEKASTPNRTVIITVVNKAYAEQSVKAETTMLDLFIESFWLGEDTRHLVDHLLIVAVDQTAYDRCKFKRLHCFKLETEGVDFGGEKIYMSSDFVNMMWRRTLLLLDVLRHGYNFIFTDTDVMWLRNPFSRLNANESIDLQISTDWFNGDPESEKNAINTGFYYARSNNKTIALFETWYARKDNSTGKKEQDVLFDLMKKGTFGRLSLRARFLDTLYFSGFCTDSKDVKAVTTVHANCCRSIKAKVRDLSAVLRDWKRFKAVNAYAKLKKVQNVTLPFRWSAHLGCRNSWNTSA